jgi:hypothetical protein
VQDRGPCFVLSRSLTKPEWAVPKPRPGNPKMAPNRRHMGKSLEKGTENLPQVPEISEAAIQIQNFEGSDQMFTLRNKETFRPFPAAGARQESRTIGWKEG